jgi:hypothetical protein
MKGKASERLLPHLHSGRSKSPIIFYPIPDEVKCFPPVFFVFIKISELFLLKRRFGKKFLPNAPSRLVALERNLFVKLASEDRRDNQKIPPQIGKLSRTPSDLAVDEDLRSLHLS